MKKTFVLMFLFFATLGTLQAQPSVGVSISINQPGVYGRINIGDVPPVALVLPQPIVIHQPRVVVDRRPIYLYVPPGHQQQWARYCGRYGACDQPVYFVQDRWVRERYEQAHPGWHKKHGKQYKENKHKNGEGKSKKGRGRDE